MRKLDTVTLLCLDTRDPDAAVLGMQKCMEQLEFPRAILLTRDGFYTKDSRITVLPIDAITSIEAYSQFMIKNLGDYFSTSHVLVVQWDGFVANPEVWDDAFLAYDYIGAPWKNHRHAVGNGGFSLRSRKLVDALRDPLVCDLNPEDYAICDRYHDLLVEKYGIRFAPIAVARKFSCETFQPPSLSFGVHGVGSVHWITSDQEHLAFLKRVPEGMLLGSTGRTLIKDCIDTKKPLSANYILDLRSKHGSLKQKIDAAKLGLKLRLGLRRNRMVEDIYSVFEPDAQASQRAQQEAMALGAVLKKRLQRDLVLKVSGQNRLRSAQAPVGAKRILWCYDWHMLGDCELKPDLIQGLSQKYEIDICVPTGPLDVFEKNPLFKNVFRDLDACTADYDFLILNDINTRTIKAKIKRFKALPWTVLVEEVRFERYRKPDFVASRIRQIFALEGK